MLIVIYQPLGEDMSIHSIGGIFLACAMIAVAKFYEKILNIRKFFQISMIIELIMLVTVLFFMTMKPNFTSAILIYSGYQITFIFGGYLVRAETLVVEDKKILAKVDINKNTGYLIGLAFSFMFYKTLEYTFKIEDATTQINILHYFLLILQSSIIMILARSFNFK